MMARRAAKPAVYHQQHHSAKSSESPVRFQGRLYSSRPAEKQPQIVHVQDLMDKLKKNAHKEKSSIQEYVRKYPLHAQFACAHVDFRERTALETYIHETKYMIVSRKKDVNKLDSKGKNVMYHALNSLPTLYCRMAVDVPSTLVKELLRQGAKLVETQFYAESALTHLNNLVHLPILYARIPEIMRQLLEKEIISPVRPDKNHFSPLRTTFYALHHLRMPAERTLVALFNAPGFKLNKEDFQYDGTVLHWLFNHFSYHANVEMLRKIYLSVYLIIRHSTGSLNEKNHYQDKFVLDLFIEKFPPSKDPEIQLWRNAIITLLNDQGAKCSGDIKKPLYEWRPTYPVYGDYFRHKVLFAQSKIYDQPFSKVIEQLSGPPQPWEVY
jgi:hypothetical protein